MAVCSTCGQENPEIARFCLACATPLTARPTGRDVRKTVTVVFSDVVGSTALGEQLDPESLRRVMGRYFDEMRAVHERHGGLVEKFIGDAVLAVFGIPAVHEDDALRAVRAAAEMRDALVPLNDELERERGVRIQVRVGVNTGEVVAGDGAAGQTFATGDAVNVAARFEQAAAPGEILIGESTYRLVRNAVTVEPVKPLSLKGKAAAVSAVRLVAVTEVAGDRPRSTLVGRDDELDRLRQVFNQVVRERECRIVTVIGSAGVGKTRLVEQFIGERADDATIARGRCLSYGEGLTYWPIRGVVSQAAELSGQESAQEAKDKIRKIVELAADADLIVERVAETVGVATTVQGHSAASWAIRRLLEEIARRRPLIVVFDDIHWAEPTFLDLLETLPVQSRGAPILIVCMARPELLEVRPGWSASVDNASTVQVMPLGEDDSERLLANLLGQLRLAPTVRMRITAAAEGTPLFLEEIVAMLVEEGLTEDSADISVPATIKAVLAARLDRLDFDDRAVLERGAVEGKVFHRSAVLDLSPPAARPSIDGRLRSLVQRQLIQPGEAGFTEDKTFRFHHQLIRDVAYESLPKSERAQLHERFAGWVDAKTGKRTDKFDEIVGHHLQQAHSCLAALGPVDAHGRELASRASDRLANAGLRAYARGDMWGAGKLLARAQSLLPSDSAAGSALQSRLDDALFETGQRTRGRFSRASLRCFWRWPLGHRWEVRLRADRMMLRCVECGRARRASSTERYSPEAPALRMLGDAGGTDW